MSCKYKGFPMPHRILVSGANGFIASHTIERLLAAGHDVVGTVRHSANQEKNAYLHTMENAEKHLTLVAADLTDPDPFGPHVEQDYIIHMASPYVLHVKDPKRDLVDPAVKGTVSMLEAAAKSKRVKRVVFTSSMAAITDEPEDHMLTEADWNEKSSLTRNPYYYSKTMAERAAWEFMDRVKPNFNLVAINPFLVIGPAHTSALNTSNQIMANIIKGLYPAIMALNWGMVDVRDVANAHILAMENEEASGRYLCASGNMEMNDVVSVMRQCGYGHTKLPTLNFTGPIGTWLMRLASYTQPSGLGSYLRTHLGRVPRFDNTKIKRDLGIDFMNPEDSLRETLQDLSKWGHIPEPQT